MRAGADVVQIFDSWVGCLSVEDYRRYALVPTTRLIKRLQKETGVPIIYFGTDSATLLPSMVGDRSRSDRTRLAHSAR